MKLIIDIDEEDYNLAKRQVAVGFTNPLKMRIANGTPLDDIKAELTEWHNMKHSSLSDVNYQIMLDIIDRHTGERSE